jgi:hypothetical protein
MKTPDPSYGEEIIDAYESWLKANLKLFQISRTLMHENTDPDERPSLIHQYNIWANRILGLEDEYPEIIEIQNEPF